MTVKEFSENELLFNKLYEKTKDWGRAQFVNNIVQMQYEIENLIRENQELKSQKQEWVDLLDKFKTQQKEFIEWLEDKLNMCDGFLDTIKSDLEEISYAGIVSGKTYIETQIMKNEIAMKCYEEVLSKYKEIIGGNNDQ